MKLSDYVVRFLEDNGVRDVFMLSGGGCLHLVDSFGESKKINYICNHHEQACAIAAEAYAQYKKDIGVALVTTGPGGTNAITGVTGAYIDSTPLLVLSGQVKTADIKKNYKLRQMGPQEVDIIRIVESITKYAVTIKDPSEIKYHLQKAIYLAKNGRPGPVWLDIPLDIQGAQIDEKNLKEFTPEKNTPSTQLDETVKKVILGLMKAKRPAFLLGNGIRLSGAEDQMMKLINKLRIPTLSTWKMIDFLDDKNEYYCGRPGSIGQRGANFTQQNSDFMITIGARLEYGQIAFSQENFVRCGKKIIVDVDPFELEKFGFENALLVEADAKCFVESLLKQLDGFSSSSDWAEWLEFSKGLHNKYPVVLPKHLEKNNNRVNLYALIEEFSKTLDSDAIVVPGSSGACSEVLMQAFKISKGQRVVNTPGLGAMGFGLPASIGVCIASGKKQTICINGDGGLQLNIHELEVIARLNLPIKLFVLNNNGYGSIVASQMSHCDGRLHASTPASGVTMPSFEKLSYAFGIEYKKIASQNDVSSIVKDALASPGPVLCEVMVDLNHLTLPRVKSKILDSGQIVSLPMEDLFPFLDRNEFKKCLKIPAFSAE